MANVQIKGLNEARKRLSSLKKKFPRKLKAALVRRCELIMTDSKENYVPIDQSTLKNSGHVVVDPNKIAATLAFGGPAEAYAVIQHEREDFHHEVGGAKYLERPLLLAMTTFAADIAADVKVTEEDVS